MCQQDRDVPFVFLVFFLRECAREFTKALSFEVVSKLLPTHLQMITPCRFRCFLRWCISLISMHLQCHDKRTCCAVCLPFVNNENAFNLLSCLFHTQQLGGRTCVSVALTLATTTGINRLSLFPMHSQQLGGRMWCVGRT